MTQYSFGIGALIAKRTDVTPPTPSQFGTLSEVDLDMSFTIKELMGQYQAAAALARGAMKITGKAKAAKLNARSFNDVFFGQTLGSGSPVLVALMEAGTAASDILTVSNHSTFVADLGVINVSNQTTMVRVASSPAIGQYSVNESTGVYTFSTGANPSVLVTYEYTGSTGKMVTISQQLMGTSPTFSLVLAETYNGGFLNLQLNAVIAPKLAMSFKNQDFMIPEFDFQAGADANGNIGSIWMTE